MKRELIAKLKNGKPLTKRQIDYVKERILPFFKCDCGVCRLNLGLHYGVAPFK